MNYSLFTRINQRIDAPHRRVRRPRGGGARFGRRLAIENIESRLMLSGTEVDTSLFNLDSLAADFAVISTDFDVSSRFSGTSAAEPQVSGVVASLLEANPQLTYRELQSILVGSALETNDLSNSHTQFVYFVDPIMHSIGYDTTLVTDLVGNGHGTATAGLIGASGDNSFGITGIAAPLTFEIGRPGVLVVGPSISADVPQVPPLKTDSALGAADAAASRDAVPSNVDKLGDFAAGAIVVNAPSAGIVVSADAALPSDFTGSAVRQAVIDTGLPAGALDLLWTTNQYRDYSVEFDRVAVNASDFPSVEAPAWDVDVDITEPKFSIEPEFSPVAEQPNAASPAAEERIEVTAVDAAEVREYARAEGGMIAIESLIAAIETAPFATDADRATLSATSDVPAAESATHPAAFAADIQGELARAIVFELIDARPTPLARTMVLDGDLAVSPLEAAQLPLPVDGGASLRPVQPAVFAESSDRPSGARLAAASLPSDAEEVLTAELDHADRSEVFADWLAPIAERATSFGVSPLLVMVALERVASNRRRRDVESTGPPKPTAKRSSSATTL